MTQKIYYIKATFVIKFQHVCLEHGQVNALSQAKFWIQIQPLIRVVIVTATKVSIYVIVSTGTGAIF